MKRSDTLDRSREAFERQAWAEAYAAYSAADQETPLPVEDLEHLAAAAYLAGRDEAGDEIWARAHQEYLQQGAVERAARCAFWLAFGLLHRGERARAGGWIARANRLIDEDEYDCVERGYLLLPIAFQAIGAGDLARSYSTFCRAAEIGERFGDPDLSALACHSRGRVLIRMGQVDEGVRLLDEAMVAVEADEVSALVAGEVYCSVIEGCLEIYDMRRAQEWTTALSRWCDAQPDLVPYSGECLVRRAEILQLHGTWEAASAAAERACERLLLGTGRPAAGAAFYRCAELHRLLGEFTEAEAAYREASRWGRKAQPGLALLRLMQGKQNLARAAICRAVDEANDRASRSRLLPPYIEIMLATDDVPAARIAADELSEMAAELDRPYLQAVAAQALGAVLLAEGDTREALDPLGEAWAGWQELEAPYEAAQVRVLIGLACRSLGDEDTAQLEFDAARWTFQQIGALPDLKRVEALIRPSTPEPAGGLTPREIEILRYLADGKTNRAIADTLFISERTVARHVSNIFNKLGLSNRAEATAYAYEQGLV